MDREIFLSVIKIKTLLVLDSQSIIQEGLNLGVVVNSGDNNGITKTFTTSPDLTAGQKTALQTLIDKIGMGSITP